MQPFFIRTYTYSYHDNFTHNPLVLGLIQNRIVSKDENESNVLFYYWNWKIVSFSKKNKNGDIILHYTV